jgi:hypothetical protein
LAFCGADHAGLVHIRVNLQVILGDPIGLHQDGGQFYALRSAAYDRTLPLFGSFFLCCPGRVAISAKAGILTGITPRWCNPRSREFAGKYEHLTHLSNIFRNG